MDMDLWWCPVCERAITEQEESAQRVVKHASLPPSQPRYTSRGGVYAPKGSLYCSDACREVEELNGRFAFEQLAAYLPDFLDRPYNSLSEEPDSEGTLSGTDEVTTHDISRSVSLRRRSGSAAPNQPIRTSTCTPQEPSGPTVSHHNKLKGLTPAIVQPTASSKELETGLPSRRVPILLSPNGTPLIQPTFPQRPTLGAQQRRHHSQIYSPARSTAAVRPSSGLKVSTTGVLPKPSTSVPIYHPSPTVGQSDIQQNHKTKTILNHQLKSPNDHMEFDPLVRPDKHKTSLLQHYALFFRSRPGSHQRPQWADFNDELDHHHHHPTLFEPSRIGRSGRNGLRQDSRTDGSQNSRRSSLHPPGRRIKPSSSSSSSSTTTTTIVVAGGGTSSSTKTEPGSSLPQDRHHRKYPPAAVTAAASDHPSRSWTWDHLPPDVPQYPAMDLAQIRVSKLLLLQPDRAPLPHTATSTLKPLNPTSTPARPSLPLSTTTNTSTLKDNASPRLLPNSIATNPPLSSNPPPSSSSKNHLLQSPALPDKLRLPPQPHLIQTKKKLFIFQ